MRVKLLTDNITREQYFQETATGLQFRRTVGGIVWPHGDRPGSVAVLGEMRAKINILDRVHEVHVLQEETSLSVQDIAEKSGRLQDDWLLRIWATPLSDSRVYLLDDLNDVRRRNRQRALNFDNPPGWNGKGEGLMPYYHAMVQRRTDERGIKSLYFGPNSPGAVEIGALQEEDLQRKPTDFPAAAAVFFALAEIDRNRLAEWEDRPRYEIGPADRLGGY